MDADLGSLCLPIHKKDVTVAFLLKMVQLTSNLRAGKLLIEYGFLYEWIMVRRLVRETVEDILFLALAETTDTWTKNHGNYLADCFLPRT